MKKIILIATFILFAGVTSLFAQKSHDGTLPIPSYNVKLNHQTAEFVEGGGKTFAPPSNTKEKREMEIVISSSSTSPLDVYAKVWLIKKKGNVVKGPYTIYLDQPFTRSIDLGKWSVVMDCDFDNVQTSVCID
jgi:hypothetical protein